MIYTCTFSPSIDYTTYLPSFKTGRLNRAQEVQLEPGGKGINVSRVLARLGSDSTALGLVGGFTGAFIKDFLEAEGIRTGFVQTDGTTRINVKIKASVETELNGPSPDVTEQQMKALQEKVANLAAEDWFVLAGSLPGSVPDSFYEELAAYCQERRAHFVLDTSGPLLLRLVRQQPFLIKPNAEELGDLFSTEIRTAGQAAAHAQELVEQGARHVIVSMGGEGAVLASEDGAFFAEAPQGTVINTVGAGDSLVAGFISAYADGADPVEAFRTGVASGSATAFRPDLCERTDVEALLTQIRVTPFEEQDVKK
ncbi:1-phosphofructokinase [Indiicoccus explosivorum]|uniref:1-phosphofructokinase n=1 Tax=Indiicoccus explosivorum TaxID=1917864 RepID=UPI000B452CA9|nr:1-phosphofructokinase [Indiicoccus explosivorum]